MRLTAIPRAQHILQGSSLMRTKSAAFEQLHNQPCRGSGQYVQQEGQAESQVVACSKNNHVCMSASCSAGQHPASGSEMLHKSVVMVGAKGSSQIVDVFCTMRCESTCEVLPKSMLKYYRISKCCGL